MFGFDDRFAMFDVTPVENQFILEYLPEARGDYVKVYLYGLMRCYHPEESMTVDSMSHELGLTEEEVKAAFRYWERRRLVRRVSDNPMRWQYVNLAQKSLLEEDSPDPEYEAFSSAIYETFDRVRRLHGSELSACFEWHEELGLETEVVLMLLHHMVEIKGKNFKIAEAGKLAREMAEENIRTVEAAEEFLTRNGKANKGARRVLKKLGKNYLPSDEQINMYRKWTEEWGLSPETIDEAVKLTARGDPSMGYLEGILKRLMEDYGEEGSRITPGELHSLKGREEQLRDVLRELGRGEVNRPTLEKYEQMRALYPQEVILIAARECGRGGKGTEDVVKLLTSWKEKGLETREEVEKYVRAFRDQGNLIRELRKIWGTDETRAGKADRSYVTRWQTELGYGEEMILLAAPMAAEAKKPMPYLDKILTAWHEQGIRTPEEAQKELKKGAAAGETPVRNRGSKTVVAQEYEQRDYSQVQDELMEKQNREMEAFLRGNGSGTGSGNGGEGDA